MKFRFSGIIVIIMISALVLAGCTEGSQGDLPGVDLGVSLANEVFNTIDNIRSNIAVGNQEIQGINKLGYDLTQAIYQKSQENVIFSPYSLANAMAMLANGAEGETQTEILNLLGVDAADLNMSYNEIINLLNSYGEEKNLGDTEEVQTTQLNTANSAWFNKDLPIKQAYADELKKYFDAESLNVDFAAEDTKDIMNAWIEEKTNNLLKDTIDETNPDDVAYLINTLYFKGTWLNEFDAALTESKPFHVDDNNDVMVDMMQGTLDIEYYEDERCQIIGLPYYDAVMYVVLPKTSISEFMDIGKFAELDAMIKEANQAEVEISFPKFSYKNSNQLNTYLMDMGVQKAFDAENAEFGKITDLDIVVSKVFQNATIEVDEVGTEAAAVTVVQMVLTAMPMPLEHEVFNCDRPFLYVIKDSRLGVNLFMGVVNNPQYDQK